MLFHVLKVRSACIAIVSAADAEGGGGFVLHCFSLLCIVLFCCALYRFALHCIAMVSAADAVGGGGVSPQGRSVNSLTLRSVLTHNCWCTCLQLLVYSTNCILVHYQTIQCPHTQLLVYTCALPDNTVVSYTNVVCLYL